MCATFVKEVLASNFGAELQPVHRSVQARIRYRAGLLTISPPGSMDLQLVVAALNKPPYNYGLTAVTLR